MKKTVLVKSLLVSVLVLAVMATAGFSLLYTGQLPLAAGKVDTGYYAAQATLPEVSSSHRAQEPANLNAAPAKDEEKALEQDEEKGEVLVAHLGLDNTKEENTKEAPAQSAAPQVQAAKEPAPVAAAAPAATPAPVVAPTENKTQERQETADRPAPAEASTPAVQPTALKAPVDYRAQETSAGSGQSPAAAPEAAKAPEEESAPAVQAEPVKQVAPVSYSYGKTGSYVFRIEVTVVNSGADEARDIFVAVPFLENSSPYQSTSLKSTNYSVVSSSGRLNTFSIGELAPGESATIVADFNISARTISINSTNETVEKARRIFQQYAGSGNCRDLARSFIRKANEQGIKAREVIGFARPRHGAMTSGSLQGARHSWAEFYVDGLGWVPVDLTFQYFGSLPHTSHIVECYSDQSIKVNYSGGNLGATWSNSIL